MPQFYVHFLPRATQHALKYLSDYAWLKQSEWYLAGGTALALQEGHRSSIDLDFFTQKKEFSEEKLINHFPKTMWTTDILREGTVYGKLLKAKTSFIAYPFFLPRKPYHWYGMVRVLDVDDIAVMKIIAISQRGRKRDFIDLYWYCMNQKKLWDVIHCLKNQYPTVSHNYAHIIKSLTYFVDAEEDPMPKLFFKASWTGIKKYFRREVPQVAREILKLR